MVLIVYSIILLILFTWPMIYNHKKKADMLNPINILCAYNILTIIPYFIGIALDNNVLSSFVRNHYSFTTLEMVATKYFLIQSIAFIASIIGIALANTNNAIPKYKIYREKKFSLFIALGCFVIALLSFLLIMRVNGGILNYIKNINSRTFMLRGRGYLVVFLELFLTSLVIGINYIDSKGKKIIFIVMTLISILCYSSLGGRNNTINLIITLIVFYNYKIKRIKIIDKRMLLIVLFMILYIVIMPTLRQEKSIYIYIEKPNLIVENVKKDSLKVFKEISCLDQNLFVMSYFNRSNYWLGKSFLDLPKSIIPSSIYPDKPPVDDGVYIWNLVLENDVTPSLPYSVMEKSSWPLETMGNMYANFGILGVVIGMILLGYILGALYKKVIESSYDMYYIFIYTYACFNFSITNLRVFNFIMFIVLQTLVLRAINYKKISITSNCDEV